MAVEMTRNTANVISVKTLDYQHLFIIWLPVFTKRGKIHPLLQKAVKIDERQISITRSHNMAPGQGRPGGIVEYQYTWKKIDKIPQNTRN